MELGDIYPVVITIVLIGLVLGIGMYIMAEVEDELYLSTTVAITNTTTASVINETANVSVGTIGSLRDCALTPTAVTNASSGNLINSGNYTVNGCSLVYTGAALADGFNNSLWNVSGSYVWSADTEASDSVNETIDGVGSFAGWIAIIMVVIAAAIVLGIVLSSFGRKTPGV